MVGLLVKTRVKTGKHLYVCVICKTTSSKREECCGRLMRKRYK